MKRITNISGAKLPMPDGRPLAHNGSRIVTDHVAAGDRLGAWERAGAIVVEDADAPRAGQEEAELGMLEARHRGSGSYSIMREDEEVVEGLTKKQAQSFNAGKPDERRRFLERKNS